MSAIYYELVIKRAFGVGRFKKGADADLFRSLIDIEYEALQNPSNTKIQIQYNKELSKIKDYLLKALGKVQTNLVKQKATQSQISQIKNHTTNIVVNSNKTQLSSEIDKIIETFNVLGIQK